MDKRKELEELTQEYITLIEKFQKEPFISRKPTQAKMVKHHWEKAKVFQLKLGGA